MTNQLKPNKGNYISILLLGARPMFDVLEMRGRGAETGVGG
jgi:hypothetical protein